MGIVGLLSGRHGCWQGRSFHCCLLLEGVEEEGADSEIVGLDSRMTQSEAAVDRFEQERNEQESSVEKAILWVRSSSKCCSL